MIAYIIFVILINTLCVLITGKKKFIYQHIVKLTFWERLNMLYRNLVENIKHIIWKVLYLNCKTIFIYTVAYIFSFRCNIYITKFHNAK